MEINSLEWHENNLKNSLALEKRELKGLKLLIQHKLDMLNRISYQNIFHQLQVDMANLAGKKKYTERYQAKLFKESAFRC